MPFRGVDMEYCSVWGGSSYLPHLKVGDVKIDYIQYSCFMKIADTYEIIDDCITLS